MKKLIFFFALFLTNYVSSQHNLISTHPFFRDKLFSTANNTPYCGNSMLPITESSYDLQKYTKDTTVHYYEFAEVLFKKHIVEVKGKDYFFTISPVVEFSVGVDPIVDSKKMLYQNTRGFLVEGDLTKNFSFSTALYENQARFSSYENDFISQHGEFYIKPTGYVIDNAVVPGAGRTKTFKHLDDYDYAFALGNIIYHAHKKLDIIFGNNQQFIGSGYRSLLLSDNSCGSPYLKVNYNISKRWSFSYLRTRNMNLVRKKATSTVESYYQPKGLSVNYLSFQANEKLNISLFEGAIWQKGDSLSTGRVNPMFYNPVPLIAAFLKDSTCYATNGLNINWLVNNRIRIYAQAVIGNLNTKQFGLQLGYRGNNYFNIKNLYTQIEYNYVSPQMYRASFYRMSYSNYNLPLAHPKGNGFHEMVLRAGWEYQRCYAEIKSITYFLTQNNPTDLLPVPVVSTISNDKIFHNNLEFGYRMNKKLNLCFFGSITYRVQTGTSIQSNLLFQTGMKTSLISHYNDY